METLSRLEECQSQDTLLFLSNKICGTYNTLWTLVSLTIHSQALTQHCLSRCPDLEAHLGCYLMTGRLWLFLSTLGCYPMRRLLLIPEAMIFESVDDILWKVLTFVDASLEDEVVAPPLPTLFRAQSVHCRAAFEEWWETLLGSLSICKKVGLINKSSPTLASGSPPYPIIPTFDSLMLRSVLFCITICCVWDKKIIARAVVRMFLDMTRCILWESAFEFTH